MPEDQRIDFLIVGQGLAGSLLAWRLLEAGQRIAIIDPGDLDTASRVAAGLVNPLAGRRLFLIHHAHERLEAARSLYGRLADEAGRPFYHETPLLRLFVSTGQQADWRKRRSDSGYRDFIDEAVDHIRIPAGLHAPLGGFYQRHTGWLDTTALLDHLRQRFDSAGVLLREHFEHGSLDIGDKTVRWRHLRADGVIFCEGHMATANPFFAWLPFQLTRGEILTLESEKTLPREMINAGKWLLPLGRHRFRFGATYDREQLDSGPSAKGRDELLQAFKRLAPGLADADVLDHRSGVRPNTRDKLPFLGRHPQHPRLWIFNGFGSRGSMMIPWYSRVFTDHLLHDRQLPADADIARCDA